MNKKKKDYEDRMKGGKNENQEQKVDIHKIENKKNSGGKYSKEKLNKLESNLSDDSNDFSALKFSPLNIAFTSLAASDNSTPLMSLELFFISGGSFPLEISALPL